MSGRPEWKKAMWESNVIGWIGFFLLVLAIGFGTIYFGTGSSEPDKAPAVSQAAQ